MIFLGLTVLTEDPNRRDDPTHTAERSKIRTDSVTGPFSELEKGFSQQQVRPFSWFMGSRADIDAFRAFREERKGRLVPFWIPTWHHDVILATAGIVGNSSITVRNINYTRHMFAPPTTWRRYLALIKIGSGIQYIKRIDAAVEGVDTEELTLDSPLAVNLPVSQWMLSFLTLCRVETDEISLHWHSPTSAEASFSVRELPLEMPVVPV
jgi:hypothetical protein